MSWFYRNAIRPILFTQEAESIHDFTMNALNRISRRELLCDAMNSFFGAPDLPIELFGLRFPNPVGLAAGMDKRAVALPAWEAMGFGFSELGGTTWHAQPGNPAPRVFRAISEQAIVNRMGFNNPGAAAIAEALSQWRTQNRWPNHPVGMNLGKSKITPLNQAAEDYANSFRLLQPHLDFFVVNVSSPNTPNLRQLQDKAALDEILAAIQEVQKEVRGARCEVRGEKDKVQNPESDNPQSAIRNPQSPKPVLVKVAPDLSFEALDEILELVGPRQIAGIVATNTTISRPETHNSQSQRAYAETGGLSGRPLRQRSTDMVRHLYQQTHGRLPIIGVGGIFTADDAWEKIMAGASLVQLYTALVYEGPGVIRSIVNGLIDRLEAAGMTRLQDAVGSAVR